MAHSAQAKKRIRQSEQRRSVNRSRKSEIRTLTRRLLGLVEQKAEALRRAREAAEVAAE